MAARFSGRQTAPGSVKHRGNKGVLKAYRIRKQMEAAARDEVHASSRAARAAIFAEKTPPGTLKKDDNFGRDTKGKRRKRGHKKRLTAQSEQVQALMEKFNTRI